MNPKTVGKFIETARKFAEMSRAELAEKAGVARMTVYRLETTGHCTLSNYLKVRAALSINRLSFLSLP